jgi:subtilisin family serine protease
MSYLEVPVPADAFTGMRALNTQSYTESNIKLGVEHEAARLFTLAGNTNSDSILITGSNPIALKARTIGYDGVGIAASVFRSPIYSGESALVVPRNPNDINPVVSEVELYTDAIVTNTGTEVFAPSYLLGGSSQQSKGAVLADMGQEKILRPNTTYLLRLTSLDSQSMQVAAYISWYEGALDLPLPS